MASTTKPTQSSIVIKLHPFQSSACHRLITALDDEVDEMYPDAADFPYEGPGTWVSGVPDTNLVPKQTGMNETNQAKGQATKDVLNGDESAHDVVWQNEDPNDMQCAEEKGELFFFVAFPTREATLSGQEEEYLEHEAIGCVGVRALPYFPLHRAPVGDDMISVQEARPTEPITAEVKRMYVVPSWRGRCATLPSTSVDSTITGTKGQSVAALLLQHTEAFAREQMKAQRLVLETGSRQLAAMKLYSRAGWTRCKEFGDYSGAGEDVGGLSRCWEKMLY